MPQTQPPQVNYLRLSITDRCNLRCVYCLPGTEFEKLPSREILSYEEFLRLAGVAAAVGLRKIRVTGGEPLVRQGVVDFLRRLTRVPGVAKVCLTTNGVLLADLAGDIFAAGVRHLNLSLDTLDAGRYAALTGGDHLARVLTGLERALALGFQPLKLNCVVLKGINDQELVDLARLARHEPLEVRFIEFMPMGAPERWQAHFLPMAEVKARLAELGPLTAVAAGPTAGPAELWQPAGFKGRLGFISPVSSHHCPTCNRLRLTAAGKLKPCLFAATELDVKEPLRRGASDAELAHLLREAVRHKARRPERSSPPTPGMARPMRSLGG
ncbi:MAG: GTP 3',8-cyclase MoaA [Syntrophobacterales bacterium]|nr:GTP 3',8-cyclase MoaA [Syntrophobacterales bacterium]